MPKVTYVDHSGRALIVDVPIGMTVMEGAVRNGIDGVQAECGGAMACATCHVYVGEAWTGRFTKAQADEMDMLGCATTEVKANSRLSCQLTLSDNLDGLIIHLPESQH